MPITRTSTPAGIRTRPTSSTARSSAREFDGYTLAEIPESTDPDRVLRYFRALWLAYQPAARSG
jgi:hypothetical protein